MVGGEALPDNHDLAHGTRAHRIRVLSIKYNLLVAVNRGFDSRCMRSRTDAEGIYMTSCRARVYIKSTIDTRVPFGRVRTWRLDEEDNTISCIIR